MASSVSISRDEWLSEMKDLCPSPRAFEAYVELEQFVVNETDLIATYRRNTGGKSHFATFNGSAQGHRSVIQIFDGHCELIWRSAKPIPNISEDQDRRINEALDRFRESLEGDQEKAWETVKVLRLGTDRVKDALSVVARELLEILDE